MSEENKNIELEFDDSSSIKKPIEWIEINNECKKIKRDDKYHLTQGSTSFRRLGLGVTTSETGVRMALS